MIKRFRVLILPGAYYVGRGQEFGKNEGGYLLCRLAEQAGYRFDQDDGESVVNKKIMDLMNEIYEDVGLKKCSGVNSVGALKDVRFRVDKIIAQMGVPLIQSVINEMHEMNNRYLIESYSVAIIAQLVGCSEADFKNVIDAFINKKFTGNIPRFAPP